MPLGRAGHDVVYNKKGKRKYASSKSGAKKGMHRMPNGKMMKDEEMDEMMRKRHK